MGMRAAQIHKAGAPEFWPAIRTQRPKPTMKARSHRRMLFPCSIQCKNWDRSPLGPLRAKTFRRAREPLRGLFQ